MSAIKKARNYYLSELMMCFNFVFNEMCHGTGSAANCDFNNVGRIGKYYGRF